MEFRNLSLLDAAVIGGVGLLTMLALGRVALLTALPFDTCFGLLR